jgi:hypothetical protein
MARAPRRIVNHPAQRATMTAGACPDGDERAGARIAQPVRRYFYAGE